jgi:thioredoxin 2
MQGEQTHTDQSGVVIIRCPQCGVRNRIPAAGTKSGSRCGKCGASLQSDMEKGRQPALYVLRCTECGAKNRIPADKMHVEARCGKCGAGLQTGDLLAGHPLIVTDGTFIRKVLKSPLPVLLDCYAPWCGACRLIDPFIEELAGEWSGRIRVGKLNVDENKGVASKFQISGTPTLLIFDNGKLKERFTGALSKQHIMQKMVPYL